MSEPAAPAAVATNNRRLWLVLVAGAAVTAGLALFGTWHTPNYSFSLFGTDALAIKSKLASALLGLALLQLLLALWIYGRLPRAGAGPRFVRPTHRVLGLVLFLGTLPVAIHCMFAYGVQTTSARVTVHSLAGCFFYGVFVAKVIMVRSRRMPGWVLPVAGGLLLTLIAVLWCTSALWFYTGVQIPPG